MWNSPLCSANFQFSFTHHRNYVDFSLENIEKKNDMRAAQINTEDNIEFSSATTNQDEALKSD